jgi:hypothetical protein
LLLLLTVGGLMPICKHCASTIKRPIRPFIKIESFELKKFSDRFHGINIESGDLTHYSDVVIDKNKKLTSEIVFKLFSKDFLSKISFTKTFALVF